MSEPTLVLTAETPSIDTTGLPATCSAWTVSFAISTSARITCTEFAGAAGIVNQEKSAATGTMKSALVLMCRVEAIHQATLKLLARRNRRQVGRAHTLALECTEQRLRIILPALKPPLIQLHRVVQQLGVYSRKQDQLGRKAHAVQATQSAMRAVGFRFRLNVR
jgi:hypothetical protein